MNKIRKRISFFRTLQILFYVAGLPLTAVLVFHKVSPLSEYYLTADKAFYGLYAALAIWGIITVLQLIMKAAAKKNRLTRACVVGIVAAVLTVAPLLYIDFIMKSQYDEYAAAFEEKGYEVNSFTDELTNYQDYAASINADIYDFALNYNLTAKNGSFSLDQFKGDKLYNINADGTEPEYSEEAEAYLSPNGMLADGYVFGYKQASQIIRDYYNTKNAFRARGKDVDAELIAALVELQANPASEWNAYKNGTAPASAYIRFKDEYAQAYDGINISLSDVKVNYNETAKTCFVMFDEIYNFECFYNGYFTEDLGLKLFYDEESEIFGNTHIITEQGGIFYNAKTDSFLDADGATVSSYDFGAIAAQYYITEARLEVLLGKLGQYLGEVFSSDVGAGLVADLTSGILGSLISGLLPGVDLGDLIANFNSDLDSTKLIEIAVGFGLDSLLYGLIYGEEMPADYVFGTADLMKLLANFSTYQSPSAYPIFYFIEDAELKAYAYAQYYATVHGSVVGSVLIGDQVGIVGALTGSPNEPYTEAELLELFDRVDYAQTIESKYYVWLTLRDVLLKTSAVIVLSLCAFYLFQSLAAKEYGKLEVKGSSAPAKKTASPKGGKK